MQWVRSRHCSANSSSSQELQRSLSKAVFIKEERKMTHTALGLLSLKLLKHWDVSEDVSPHPG